MARTNHALKLNDVEREAFKKMAQKAGLPTSEWMRLVLRKKAGLDK